MTKHLLLPTSNAEFAREYVYLSVREESGGTAVHTKSLLERSQLVGENSQCYCFNLFMYL